MRVQELTSRYCKRANFWSRSVTAPKGELVAVKLQKA